MNRKSFSPIISSPILTHIDSNRFLGPLTLPIQVFLHEYHTDTNTDFPKDTVMPILIPILVILIIGLSRGRAEIWKFTPMAGHKYDNLHPR